MKIDTIHSLGSRCQTSEILRKYKYREFSGFFDFINTHKIDTLNHILENQFEELLKKDNNITLTCYQEILDPETQQTLKISNRTSNKFYNLNPYNIHECIFPHHDLNSEKDYNHFIECKKRFKKLKNFNVLLNYSFNKWENDITLNQINKTIEIIQKIYQFKNFKICFIGIEYSNESRYQKIYENNLYDIWILNIKSQPYTGGLFVNEIDNENYINIIKTYDISDQRISKNEIDNINYEF